MAMTMAIAKRAVLAMLMLSAAAPATQASTPTADWCQPDDDGYCTRSIMTYNMTFANPKVEIFVNTAMASSTTIELPTNLKRARDPVISNKDAFVVTILDRFIDIQAKKPDKMEDTKESKLMGAPGMITLDFEGGLSVTLRTRINRRERSVTRLVLTCSESDELIAFADTYFQGQQAELEKERGAMMKNIGTLAARRQAAAMAIRHECNEFPFERMRAASQLLSVFGESICREGNHIFIRYRLKNRRTTKFVFESLKVTSSGKNSTGDMKAEWVFANGLPDAELPYDAEITGVAFFAIDPDNTAAEFALTITENGGEAREVTLHDFHF